MHSDNNLALGFRPGPRDCSIAREAMVLISGSSLFETPRSTCDPAVARVQVAVLELARMFELPLINSRMLMPQARGEAILPIASAGSAIEVFDRTTPNLLHCTPLRQRVENLGRRVLILCGAIIEVDVHLTAMTALKRGFEVHVVVDACISRSPATESTMLQSLANAGVRLSTLYTLAGQLLADVTDPSALPVLALIERLDSRLSVDAPRPERLPVPLTKS